MTVYHLESEELFKIGLSQSLARLLIGNQIVESDFHQALYDKTNLLGIKPIDRTQSQEVFAVKNSIWGEGLKYFGEQLGVGSKELAFGSANNSWSCYFLGDLFGRERNMSFEVDEFAQIRLIQPSNFVPVIASVNGFDFNDKLRFYLLATSKEGIQNGFLTIGKFGLHADVQKKYTQAHSDYQKTEILEEAILDFSGSFAKEMNRFQEYESALRVIESTPEELVAIALDLYNINRRIQSVSSDTNLKRRVIREYNQAKPFFEKGTNLGMLLDYMSQVSVEFSHEEQERADIELLLQERKAYSNLINRLLKGKNKDEKERDKYIKSQLKAIADLKKAGVL
jgi:hypothetical protein